MDITITLAPGYSPNVNNFTIYATVSEGVPQVIASNVTQASLAAGVQYTVDNTTTGGTVNSTGVCTSYASWTVTPLATRIAYSGFCAWTGNKSADQTCAYNSADSGVIYSDGAGNYFLDTDFGTPASNGMYCTLKAGTEAASQFLPVGY